MEDAAGAHDRHPRHRAESDDANFRLSHLRQRRLAKGLEPDDCYYFRNAAAVQGKSRLNLKTDPPPDLAIEIEITRRSITRQPIYAALGVPELWTFDGKRLGIFLLQAGKYVSSNNSLALPGVPIDRFESFLLRTEREPLTSVLREFRDWCATLGK